MRKQFSSTIESLMGIDTNLVVLLGDIGVFGFRNVFAKYPDRIYNIGICEQATTSLAAGLSKLELTPVFHSIAPFVVERAYEQLKDDFGYQKLRGNFVSVGASYDYSGLGCTHHCPGDVSIMKTIPGMNVIVPGSDNDFDKLFKMIYSGPYPNYFRLTEKGHNLDIPVTFGKCTKIREGIKGTVIAIGPMLERVINACQNIDVTILYYTTLSPFDSESLRAITQNEKVAVVEPFYEGTMAYEISSALSGKTINLLSIGVPRKFLTNYGSAAQQDNYCELDVIGIKSRLKEFFYGKS